MPEEIALGCCQLETQDGRAHRVSDPAALAAAIDAQDVGVRIDFDHQSEPASPTFRGSVGAASCRVVPSRQRVPTSRFGRRKHRPHGPRAHRPK